MVKGVLRAVVTSLDPVTLYAQAITLCIQAVTLSIQARQARREAERLRREAEAEAAQREALQARLGSATISCHIPLLCYPLLPCRRGS